MKLSVSIQAALLVVLVTFSLSGCGGGGSGATAGDSVSSTSVGSGVSDTIAPKAISSAPAGGTANVATGSAVSVFFSEPIASSSTFIIAPSLPGKFSVLGSELRFTPLALNPGTQYSVSVQGVHDLANNAMVGTYAFSFTATAAVAPSCAATDVLCVGATRTYKTIQAAFDAIQPGQTILVDDGNYAGFHINKSGTPTSRIVVRAQGSNAVITSANASSGDGIFFDKASYITVEGFAIQGRDSGGVQRLTERCIAGHNATPGTPMVGNIIRGVRCSDSGLECFYLSEFNSALVENNTILTCGRVGTQRNHGIYLANAGSNNTVIRNNTISGGNAAGAESNGIHMNGDSSVGGNGLISGLIIEGNTIYSNVQNGLNMDGVQNSIVRNNLIYDNGHDALRAYQIDAAAGPINLIVVNNTLLAPPGWAIKISEDGGGHTVFNNVLHGGNGSLCVANANIHSDWNATDNKFSANGDQKTISLTEWQGITGEDAHALVATPIALFASGGYQLATNSPARDSGVGSFNGIAAPLTDIVGTSRPKGAAFDMGAYEAN